jgi:hypothetical protein
LPISKKIFGIKKILDTLTMATKEIEIFPMLSAGIESADGRFEIVECRHAPRTSFPEDKRPVQGLGGMIYRNMDYSLSRCSVVNRKVFDPGITFQPNKKEKKMNKNQRNQIVRTGLHTAPPYPP